MKILFLFNDEVIILLKLLGEDTIQNVDNKKKLPMGSFFYAFKTFVRNTNDV